MKLKAIPGINEKYFASADGEIFSSAIYGRKNRYRSQRVPSSRKYKMKPLSDTAKPSLEKAAQIRQALTNGAIQTELAKFMAIVGR